ncbi:hypothetical protein C0993_009193, partial [Termitomyces sp. T159_Od127]
PELVTTGVHLQEYTGDGIVGGVAFKNNEERGVKVAKDGAGGEGFLEEGEYTLAFAVPVPWGVLSCEPVEGFGDPRVIINGLAVKVGKTKKGLHLFYLLRWRPVEDGLHLSRINATTSKNVVQVHNDKNVVHVMEDVDHEVLEGGGGVGHTKGHHKILKEAAVGVESSPPFMPQGYMNIVIAGAEVDLGVDFGTAEAVNKVTDEGKWIPVLFGDFVEAPVVNAKTQ